MSYFNIHKGSFWRTRGDQPLLYRKRLQTLEKAVGRQGLLLDLGCGEGFFSLRAERRGWQVTALDGLPEGAESANAKLVRGVARLGDAHQLDLPNSHFDAVVAWDLLEHLDHPEIAISEMGRVLKPGGVLAFSTPNTLARSVQTRGEASIQYSDATHVSLAPPAVWLKRLDSAGFHVERAGTDAYWDPPYPGHRIPGPLLKLHAQVMFALRFASPKRDDGENFVVLARKSA